jgi:hypothetical protein
MQCPQLHQLGALLSGYRLCGCGWIASDMRFTFGQLLINLTFCFLHGEIRILEQCINVKVSKAILRLKNAKKKTSILIHYWYERDINYVHFYNINFNTYCVLTLLSSFVVHRTPEIFVYIALQYCCAEFSITLSSNSSCEKISSSASAMTASLQQQFWQHVSREMYCTRYFNVFRLIYNTSKVINFQR